MMNDEPWGLALRCATMDKGYSMLANWLPVLRQCFGVEMIGWCLEVPPRLLCESKAKPFGAAGLGGTLGCH